MGDWVKWNQVQPSVVEADMAGLPGFDSFKDDINSCSAWSGNFGGRKKRDLGSEDEELEEVPSVMESGNGPLQWVRSLVRNVRSAEPGQGEKKGTKKSTARKGGKKGEGKEGNKKKGGKGNKGRNNQKKGRSDKKNGKKGGKKNEKKGFEVAARVPLQSTLVLRLGHGTGSREVCGGQVAIVRVFRAQLHRQTLRQKYETNRL